MSGKRPTVFLCYALLSSIVVLVVGFLGFGVRAFSTAGTTRLVFFAALVASIAILVLYYMLRRSNRETTPATVSFRQPAETTRSRRVVLLLENGVVQDRADQDHKYHGK